MDKATYLLELEKKLKNLSDYDRQYALAYYSEYLDDAESEGQADPEAVLGSVHTLAAQIKADIAMSADGGFAADGTVAAGGFAAGGFAAGGAAAVGGAVGAAADKGWVNGTAVPPVPPQAPVSPVPPAPPIPPAPTSMPVPPVPPVPHGRDSKPPEAKDPLGVSSRPALIATLLTWDIDVATSKTTGQEPLTLMARAVPD